MATTKTSIALEKEILAKAKKAAAAAGLSLSALLAKLLKAHVEHEARVAAMGRYLRDFEPNFRLTPKARAAIEAEWTAPLAPIRQKKKRRAA